MARERRRRGRQIHGWLCLDKPHGMTSTHAVSFVKGTTRAAKVGHGGTLDPLATGVLPIALGEATKTVAYVMDAHERYRFTVRFGEARSTDDAEGEVIAEATARPSDAMIEQALPAFIGSIEQVPPRFAAIKVAGERAYDLARRGETVELPPRTVEVMGLRLIERPDADHAVFEMACGRGTYVRALARDLGEQLGCLGHIKALRRQQVGQFHEERAITPAQLDELIAADALPQALVAVGEALGNLPALALTGPQAQRLRAGQTVVVAPQLLTGGSPEDHTVRAIAAGEMVALARLQGRELSPLRVFNL